MAVFQVETKNKVDIAKKPRVYFTCHPDDFERCFQKICQDIFKTHDCAIYYTQSMTEPIAADERETDLGRSNLFVIPVTFKLLTTPNRAMDEDFAYARKEHIPVLPIMMEPGIDTIYAGADKFGELQYLNPFSTDLTEISYDEKLKKYLDSVLISDELAKRVRAAFDAYIFLSYRKKDRKHANELMRLIHNIPECRDIAIWFDEFLTPGESFKDSIRKILGDSKLFALLVTPNLLEELDGKPNFVMAEEYPAAMQAGIAVLPAEMEPTEKETLSQKYKDIPGCVDPRNGQALRSRLAETLIRTGKTHSEDPIHNFLIGLAYMEGIDVEVNRKRGLELITKAAEANVPEAMSMLYSLYTSGKGIPIDYVEAGEWIARLLQFYKSKYGTDHPLTVEAMQNLANTLYELGEYETALELQETIHKVASRVFGENSPEALTPLCNSAAIYSQIGNYKKALEQAQKARDLCKKHLEDEHPLTLVAINFLVLAQTKSGNYREALSLGQRVLENYRKITSETSVEILLVKNNLSMIYTHLEDHEAAGKILEEIYPVCKQMLGASNSITLTVLGNLGVNYSARGNGEKALEIATRVIEITHKVYGEKHPYTLLALSNSAEAFADIKEYETAKKLQAAAYDLGCEVLGETHPNVSLFLMRLANAHEALHDYKNALAMEEKAYALSCKALGDSHAQTIKIRQSLAEYHMQFGDYRRAVELSEKDYGVFCELYGKAHEKTIRLTHSLSVRYHTIKEDAKALALCGDTYAAVCETHGPLHQLALRPLEDLTFLYVELGNTEKAMELWQQAYDIRVKELGQGHPEVEWIQGKMQSQKRWAAMKRKWKAENCCQYCGNPFKGILKKKCKNCGRLKDY